MIEALVQGIEKTLVNAFELGFHSSSTDIKSAFLRFLEMTLMEMIGQVALESMMTKSFDQLL